ncbi:DUF433 domain-containing protein [Thermosipho ferrireducens]|uniref:DUF433 domain-containing protein n=1 Tax=Thermosipho ferrireducens TaxID=2571116 RepID=A0ABX7S797_9BACT|nr:DUF433 domain-containing protein [Thermosipho ferrireducens]QTA38471.1 DUF433 domain-containing protein [Thermosipho ferrireducens]
MSKEKLLERIETRRDVLGGKPIIKGTRIPVELILKHIANGWEFEKICNEYGLEKADIRAAVLYAEKVLEGEEVFI